MRIDRNDVFFFILHLPFIVLGYLPAFLWGRFARCVVYGWREGF